MSIQKQLSQFFRNLRCRTASKAISGKNPANVYESASKKTKLTNDEDVHAQKRNMELLGNAKPGTMTPKTFSKLFDDTFTQRWKFIEQEATSATHAPGRVSIFESFQSCKYMHNYMY